MSDEIERDAILCLLAYAVLSDFTHMSEVHVKETVVELAKRAEKIGGMEIKNRGTDEEIAKFWIGEE